MDEYKREKVRKKYNLEMKRLEFFEQGISVPNKDDFIPMSTFDQIEENTNHID